MFKKKTSYKIIDFNNISIIITNNKNGNFSYYNSLLKFPVYFRIKKLINSLYKKNINTKKIIHVKQIHSNKIVEINGNNKHLKFHKIEADGIITNLKNILISVVTADCFPVAIFSENLNIISIVHAGWRGVYKKIHINALEEISKKYNIDKKTILNNFKIFIGSGMCSNCYEVSKDFKDNFNEKYFNKKNNKIYFDLKQIIIDGFINYGFPTNKIFSINQCTLEDGFYSFRKNKTKNRFLTGIVLN